MMVVRAGPLPVHPPSGFLMEPSDFPRFLFLLPCSRFPVTIFASKAEKANLGLLRVAPCPSLLHPVLRNLGTAFSGEGLSKGMGWVRSWQGSGQSSCRLVSEHRWRRCGRESAFQPPRRWLEQVPARCQPAAWRGRRARGLAGSHGATSGGGAGAARGRGRAGAARVRPAPARFPFSPRRN